MGYPRLIFVATISLQALVSILTLGLKALTLSFVYSNLDPSVKLTLLPPAVWTGPSWCVVVVSGYAIIIYTLLLVFAWRFWPTGYKSYYRIWCFRPHIWTIILHFKLAFLFLTTHSSSLMMHGASSNYDSDNYPTPPLSLKDQNDLKGKVFELEVWACGVAQQREADGMWATRCTIERVGRWFPLVQCVLAFAAVVVCGVALHMEEQGRGREREWVGEEKRKDAEYLLK